MMATGLAAAVWACAQNSSSSSLSEKPHSGWHPSIIYPTPREANARGLLDRRGLIHAHSVFSHDACDGAPVDDAGVRDATCLDDFRRGLCQAQHDFVFLTDHRDAFDSVEFPEALLYSAARGDELLSRNGEPVASWAACPDGSRALIMAGCEADMMPVGLEHHTAGRGSTYGSLTLAAMAEVRAAGAIPLVAHTEGYTVEQLSTLPLGGFEMYNLHANTILNGAIALELLLMLHDTPQYLPHPDLALLPLVTEDPKYLSTWGSVLATGVHRTTTMGTDCHRNTFSQLLPDGERVDSYRRMMIGFSNHLLVRPAVDGTYTDVDLKDALAAGRLYGVFEHLGYAQGFDYVADVGGAVHEMGEEVSAAASPHLKVTMPSVLNLDPAEAPPVLTVRLLVARSGGWDVVATADGSIDHVVTQPGAYRAEVRMVPRHLKPYMGAYVNSFGEAERVWIYSNAIYVVP